MTRLHFPTLCLACALGMSGLLMFAPLAAQHSPNRRTNHA